jgi:hypothetical protein
MILPDINSIKIIYPAESIADSLPTINNNYLTLQLWISAYEDEYAKTWSPIIEYYNQYSADLKESLTLAQSYSANWDSFQTIVESNSAKWIQPFTIFYPTLIESNNAPIDTDIFKNWLNQYFPIRNPDGSLNYIEGQKIIVNCYLYSYDYAKKIDITDEPYSYSRCTTSSGTIYAHCKTIISGGPIVCSQSTYYCARTIDCYPSKNVNCWYSSPYLYDVSPFGSPITSPTVFSTSKQVARGQIKANISMNFLDRRETNIAQFVFVVNECDWNYIGG